MNLYDPILLFFFAIYELVETPNNWKDDNFAQYFNLLLMGEVIGKDLIGRGISCKIYQVKEPSFGNQSI